nr:hypothetical protein [Mycobacterium sp.]
MDIVLGVSLTPTTVRMVLVEGEKGDGAIVDHDAFEVSGSDGSATPSAAEQVAQAVLGTQESAEAGGHHLTSIGVTWTDHTEAAILRDVLAARGITDVMLVSELHAAGALAQAAGRAVGYGTTALLFLNRDTATLSVVQGDDGSVVKVLSRSLHSTDAMAVLGDMAAAVAGQDTAPEGMFVVGSGVDVASVKEHLARLVDIPVSAPEESGLALARGAALASASAPTFEASTVGLAYSLDPDGPTAGAALAAAGTQLAPASPPHYVDGLDVDVPDDLAGLNVEPVEEGREPFLLVGSAMASIFVVGVVALAISLAVSIRPTADERPAPARAAIAPSAQAPAPVPEALPVQPAPPPPPPVTIKAPIPVVQEAPRRAPRKVYVEQAPAPAAPALAPAPAAPAPAPAPAALPPAPAPIAPPTVPPVWAPRVVLPPPVIVLPRPPWPLWRRPWEQKAPQTQTPSYPDYPDQPGYPNYPQQTQQQPQPQWPSPSGGNGSGGGNSEGSRGDSGSRAESGGRGGGQDSDCFLIFCR